MIREIQLPKSFRCWRRSSCVPAAIVLLPQLQHSRDFIIEGYVCLGNDPRRHEHTWMEVDGAIFDPTLIQFRRFRA